MNGCDLLPLILEERPAASACALACVMKSHKRSEGGEIVRFAGVVSSPPELPSERILKMPACAKCGAKLTKRKSTMTYNCRRHGVVRIIRTPKMETAKESETTRK